MYGQWRTRLREIAEAHRPKKIELYQKFMDEYVRILRESREGRLQIADQGGEPSEEFKEFYFSFNRDLILWGSAGVIRAWGRFVGLGIQDPAGVLSRVDALLKEIRADLGNSNRGLSKGDLIKLFLSDPSEYDRIQEDRMKDNT